MAAKSQSFLDNVIAEFGRLERKMGPVTSKCPRFRPKALLALAVARTAADLRIGAAADSRSQVNGAMLRCRDLATGTTPCPSFDGGQCDRLNQCRVLIVGAPRSEHAAIAVAGPAQRRNFRRNSVAKKPCRHLKIVGVIRGGDRESRRPRPPSHRGDGG